MKSLSTLLAVAGIASAHIALYRPIPRGGFGAEALRGSYSVTVLDFLEDTVYNLPPDERHTDRPCLRFNNNTPINMLAGHTYNTRFYAGAMRLLSEEQRENMVTMQGRKLNISQVRHGGGECRFYISYDNGVTGREIARYTVTCPDIYYNWPVTVPYDMHACTDCMFVWVWYAYNVPQAYVNCAHINVVSISAAQEYSYPLIPIKYPSTKVKGDAQANGPGPDAAELLAAYASRAPRTLASSSSAATVTATTTALALPSATQYASSSSRMHNHNEANKKLYCLALVAVTVAVVSR